MAQSNSFILKNELKKVEKELIKAEKKQLRKAANYFNKKLRAKIKGLTTEGTGNLLKGVTSVTLDHASLVGIGAPAFHALLVEYGTTDRKTDNEYHNKMGITTTGSTTGKHYFLHTMQENSDAMEKILGEEWL